jgi:hypothetical protein
MSIHAALHLGAAQTAAWIKGKPIEEIKSLMDPSVPLKDEPVPAPLPAAPTPSADTPQAPMEDTEEVEADDDDDEDLE